MLVLAKTESGPLTNADASDAGRRPGKLSDSEPKKDCVAPIDSTGGPKGVPDDRKLIRKLTKMQKDFKLCSTPEQFNSCPTDFDTLKSSFASYCRDLKLQVTDPDKLMTSVNVLRMLMIIVTIIMTNVNCASSAVLTMILRMKAWSSRRRALLK